MVPFTFIAVNFGFAGFEAVVIMASDVPVSDMVSVGFLDFARRLIEVTITTGLLLVAAGYLVRWLPGFVLALALMAFFAIATSHFTAFLFSRAFPDPAINMISVAEQKPPEIQTVSGKKLNPILP